MPSSRRGRNANPANLIEVHPFRSPLALLCDSRARLSISRMLRDLSRVGRCSEPWIESRVNACVSNAIGMRELRVKHILLLRAEILRCESRAHHPRTRESPPDAGQAGFAEGAEILRQRVGTARCSTPL